MNIYMTKKAKEMLDKKIRHLNDMDCPIKRHHKIIDNLSLFVTGSHYLIVVSDCSQRNNNVVGEIDTTWERNIPIPARRSPKMQRYLERRIEKNDDAEENISIKE